MKKTYMQPAMTLVKTEAEMMICLSKSTEEYKEGDPVLSKRRRGIFDNDDNNDGAESSNGIW